MRIRLLLVALLAVLAAAVATPAQGDAAPTAKAKGKRVLVSPRPGQVVRSHQVPVRVRSRTLTDTLRVRLNGTAIGNDFGPPRRGVRTLQASLTHGLRHGRNVLRVMVRSRRGAVRRTTVRFVVRTSEGLVGAGRDRDLAVGGVVQLRGAVRAAPRGDDDAKLRWTLVRAPGRSPAHDALLGGAPPQTLISPEGERAGFVPRVPGSYKLRLSAGGGSRAASDDVVLDVKPRNLLVPIDTMAAKNDANGDQRGIRVGDITYLLRDAKESAPSGSVLQALVLKRHTLEFVSNRKYLNGLALADDLRGLDATHLVILVLQPGGLPGFQYGDLDKAVGRIGVPNVGASLPKNTGLMSAIGVPGMNPGEADVNILTGSTGPTAPMKGYLTPDQWGNFGFVPKERVPYGFGPNLRSLCTPANSGGRSCGDIVGFHVRELDSRTGAVLDDWYANTNGRTLSDSDKVSEALVMALNLRHVDSGNVVLVESVSNRLPGETQYRPPIGGITRDLMVRIADEIAAVGGTRNGFNRIALKPGSEASGGLTYALVGWRGAEEGAGAEVAAGVDGVGEAPTLSGMLRPDRQSRLRPVVSETGPDALAERVMDEPSNRWPLDDDPGAKDALSFLGSTNQKLGSDPRARYASQRFDEAGWDRIADEIKAVEYTDVPATRREKFTQAQFLAARDELVRELGWVGNVRGYLEQLKSPVANAGVISYSDVVGIGDRVFKDIERPEGGGAFSFLEFVNLMLELAGPATHEASGTVAGLMQLGVLAFEAGENGAPAREVPFRARELGAKIVDEMQQVAKTYDAMGDVIVTDPVKLRFVGENGGCEPTEKSCPEGYSFTADDARGVYADLYRSVERTAYEEIVPLTYATYALNPERLDRQPEAKWYRCTDLSPLFPSYPWWYYSDVAQSLATSAVRLEVDPKNPAGDLWRVLVLSLPRKGLATHGKAPSDEILKRMFERVPASDNPHDGGLGISSARLMREAAWRTWAPYEYDDTRDQCK